MTGPAASGSLTAVLPDPVRCRYAAKLGLAFLVVLLVMGAVGGVTFLQTQNELQATVEDQFRASAQARADSLSSWVEQVKQDARLLTESAAVQSGDPERVQAFYERQMAAGAFPESVMAVHYLDLTGPVVRASSNEQFVGVNPKEKGVPFAQGGLSFGDKRVVISQAFIAPKVNEPVVAVIAPVQGQERAVILMVNVKTQQEALSNADSTVTRVVNGQGQVVMSPRGSELLTQNVADAGVQSPAVERGLAGEAGYVELGADGQRRAVGYAPVEGIDWVVLTEAPTSQAFAIQRQVSQNVLLMLGAAFVGLLLVGGLVYYGTVPALERLVSKAERIEDGDLDVDFGTDRDDEIGDLYRAFGSTCETIRERIAEAEQAQAEAEDALQEAERASEKAERRRAEMEDRADRLETTAQQYRETLERAAGGDLTQRLDADVDDDAMAEVAQAVNEMLDHLAETVAEVRQFAATVDESTDEITASAREIQSASEVVNRTVSGIAEEADEQNDNIHEVVTEMTDLSATVEEIASSSDEVAETARDAADLGATGRDEAADAVAEMDAIVETVETAAAEIERLDEEMSEIGEIVDLIDDIAEQTNMLALNANIEAARAGGAGTGEGFAVVADEVKNLAEETAERTGEIERHIADVQSATTTAVDDMREMRERIERGQETVEGAGDILDDIVKQVERANDGIQSINDATDDQAAATEEVVSMVEEVGDLTEKTATEAEDVVAATDQQTDAISEVTDRMDALSSRAGDLRETIETFDVQSEGAADRGADARGESAAPTDD